MPHAFNEYQLYASDYAGTGEKKVNKTILTLRVWHICKHSAIVLGEQKWIDGGDTGTCGGR